MRLGFSTLKSMCARFEAQKGVICRTRDNKVEGGDFKEAIFFIFRPFQVPKEPRQGFWDAAEPLEQSICHF
jgi:hypothetical protein